MLILASGHAYADNASNPPAAVDRTDLRLQRLDLIIPADWENDKAIPATAGLQLGKVFSPSFGTYVDLMAGLGADRPYDWGVGLGVRFNY